MQLLPPFPLSHRRSCAVASTSLCTKRARSTWTSKQLDIGAPNLHPSWDQRGEPPSPYRGNTYIIAAHMSSGRG
eukprot:7187958-Alexandrium_andersonii.AAC.1